MDDVFGTLAWNPHLDWWSGAADVAPGHRIDLHVEAANDPAAMRAAVNRAKPAWARLQATEPSVRTAVADQLTDAHNEFCDPADEFTPEQFAARLCVCCRLGSEPPPGAVELVYSDGMLLGGHWIVVPVGLDGSVGEAVEARVRWLQPNHLLQLDRGRG